MRKKVTIVISNYYKGDYIQEAVESVLNQTYKSFQVVVIDDTDGRDGIRDRLDYYFNARKMNIYLYYSNNIGLSALRNLGAKKSEGKYLLYLDADDKLHNQFLEKTVDILDNSDEQTAFAYTDTQHFGSADTCWIQPEYDFNRLLDNNYICSCSLIKRSAFNLVDGFDERNFNYWEDYEFWIAIGAMGLYGKHIPEKLFYYRIHSESGMQSKRNSILSNLYKAYIISKFPGLYSSDVCTIANTIIKTYPGDIMSWTPHKQEEYLKDEGLI